MTPSAAPSRLLRSSLSTLTLIAVALLLAIVAGRGELFLVSVPLALRLLGGTAGRRPLAYTLEHSTSAARLLEGDRLTVSLTLAATTAIPQVDVSETVPAEAKVVSGSPRRVVALGAGETARWTYELRFPERARVSLGRVHLRFWERSGLAVREAIHNDPKMLAVYPPAVPLSRLPTPLRTQASVGNYVSPLVGDGIEPGEIRPFGPGDRVKHVNWRASLRLGQLFVARQQQERNADVVLMLDTLSLVGQGSATTLHASLRAAASLAAAYLARKDRVGLIEYGGVLGWVRPGSGRLHFERVLDTLLRAEVTFTFVAKDLGVVPPRVLPPQALVIALSPLLDARFTAALDDLAGRGFDLIVLAVDPVPITRAALRPTVLADAACRLWAIERRLQLAALGARGIRIAAWNPEEPVELALARVGRRRRGRALAG